MLSLKQIVMHILSSSWEQYCGDVFMVEEDCITQPMHKTPLVVSVS